MGTLQTGEMKGMQTSDYIWKYGDAYEWMTRTRKSALPPLIVSCAITGGIQGKEMNPNLPETPEEQVEQAYDAYNAGASIIHIHARNPHKLYEPSADPQDYRRVDSLIRAKCPDVIINHTTGGGPGMSLENRIRSLDADPEMASLNLGPYVWKFKLRAREHPLSHPRPEKLVDMCVPVGYSDVEAFARAMKQRGIKPELELFHQGMFWVMRDLISQDLLAAPYLVDLVMGFQTGAYPTPANLLGLISELPERSMFTVIGLGPYQLPMLVLSILLGGHVRVGMEDNVFYSRGRLLKSNAEAVERIVRIATELNREIATPAQARQMLGLSAKPSAH
jgi:3-keto-5-aminohexanoate cleavage enzyme